MTDDKRNKLLICVLAGMLILLVILGIIAMAVNVTDHSATAAARPQTTQTDGHTG